MGRIDAARDSTNPGAERADPEEDMKRAMVRYRAKPDRVEEHEALVRAVFAEVTEKAPAGLHYGAYKGPDGVSFVHVALTEGGDNPLPTSSRRSQCRAQ
jgi:hypothetical protein